MVVQYFVPDLLLAKIMSPFGAGLGESLLHGLGPVLVEPLGLLPNTFNSNNL